MVEQGEELTQRELSTTQESRMSVSYTHLVYVLSARKGSETPQSPFGSSNDWELCKSRHTWERWQDVYKRQVQYDVVLSVQLRIIRAAFLSQCQKGEIVHEPRCV